MKLPIEKARMIDVNIESPLFNELGVLFFIPGHMGPWR